MFLFYIQEKESFLGYTKDMNMKNNNAPAIVLKNFIPLNNKVILLLKLKLEY